MLLQFLSNELALSCDDFCVFIFAAACAEVEHCH